MRLNQLFKVIQGWCISDIKSAFRNLCLLINMTPISPNCSSCSLVSKQQEEINKWKRRAYKMKEGKRDAPCTPTKRLPPLTETELNSPKKTFLDSPKSKFFDVRSSVPVPLNHPTRFFDNSGLGTVPGTWALLCLVRVTLGLYDFRDAENADGIRKDYRIRKGFVYYMHRARDFSVWRLNEDINTSTISPKLIKTSISFE